MTLADISYANLIWYIRNSRTAISLHRRQRIEEWVSIDGSDGKWIPLCPSSKTITKFGFVNQASKIYCKIVETFQVISDYKTDIYFWRCDTCLLELVFIALLLCKSWQTQTHNYGWKRNKTMRDIHLYDKFTAIPKCFC